MGFMPFALRPLLMASWVFLVILLPFRLGLDAALFFVVLRRVEGARPSFTSSP